MDESNKPMLRLVPAKPPGVDDASSGYQRRFPVRLALLGGFVLLAVIAGYSFREQRRAVHLRVELTRAFGDLADARAAYGGFRSGLEGMITQAAHEASPFTTRVAAGFQPADLRNGRGTYLRIPLASARDRGQIEQAAKAMEPDWIPSCLGLLPTSAREVYEIGAFLTPSFVAGLEGKSVMQLRVLQDTLTRRSQSDLPTLLATTRSDWFMLVLEEGANRRDAPVRIHVWDLKRNVELLRTRVKSQGILISTRILSQKLQPSAATSQNESGADASNDCSIAAAMKKTAEDQRR